MEKLKAHEAVQRVNLCVAIVAKRELDHIHARISNACDEAYEVIGVAAHPNASVQARVLDELKRYGYETSLKGNELIISWRVK